MTENVDFDALARKTVESNGAIDDLNNLWGAAFALPEWHFLARGELPNVSPYIASNAAYADGKQMVRAFTDTDRVLRFAKENNLVKADGSAPLLSLPSAKVVDYLEQFIRYGVHGIWFNSDTDSDGFFLPLKQLRPVKEHLAKINWQPPVSAPAVAEPVAVPVQTAPEPVGKTAAPVVAGAPEPPPVAGPECETLVVTVKDGLALPSGFISQATYACNFFCRVPAKWIVSGTLDAECLEKVYEQVYGQTWRSGNSDGSRYVVLDSATKILAPDEIAATNWRQLKNTKENQFWFYLVDENDLLKNVTAEEFQADIETPPKQAKADAAPPVKTDVPPPVQSDTPGDFGLADSPSASAELNLAYFRRGEVSFDTALAPLQEKIAALLENYRGAGEYGDILSLAADAPEGLIENTVRNAHGAYLRNRRFFYQPEDGTIIAATTIDSNELRQTKTNSTLRVNFALLKNLVNQTAQLYFRFEGAKNDVLELSNAIKPVLDGYGFKEIPVD